MDGFGSKFAVGLGSILSTIERDISLLYESFLQIEIISDSMIQNIDLLAGKGLIDEKDDEKEKELKVKRFTTEIDKINSVIEDLNKKLLDAWKFEKRIVILNKSKLIDFYKERFDKKWSNQESLNLANEKFKLKMASEINKPLDSIREFLNQFGDLEKFSGYEKIDMPNKEDIQEAIHINSIGYGRTAVLCVGRTIEDLINRYFNKLFEKDKFSREDYEKRMSSNYISKIGFLNGKFLMDEEFTKLKAFSFDRNKGGHPSLGNIDNQRARTLIEQGIWLVTDLQKKIKEIKSESEINEEKAREILGGRAEGGIPILYGTPEQKLEQLKGYGGESIDEMREKIKKELEEEKKKKYLQ